PVPGSPPAASPTARAPTAPSSPRATPTLTAGLCSSLPARETRPTRCKNNSLTQVSLACAALFHCAFVKPRRCLGDVARAVKQHTCLGLDRLRRRGLSVLWSLGRSERDLDDGASVGRVRVLDPAAVRLRALAHDREAETGARHAASGRCTVEPVEDV